MNSRPRNQVYMGKHAYRLAREEIGLRTRSSSVKYKGVTISYLEHLKSGQICTNLIELDDFNHELKMNQVKSCSGSRTLRIVQRLLRHIESKYNQGSDGEFIVPI